MPEGTLPVQSMPVHVSVAKFNFTSSSTFKHFQIGIFQVLHVSLVRTKFKLKCSNST